MRTSRSWTNLHCPRNEVKYFEGGAVGVPPPRPLTAARRRDRETEEFLERKHASHHPPPKQIVLVLALAPDGGFITALGGMAAASWPRSRKFVTASRALAEISRKSPDRLQAHRLTCRYVSALG
jgi:hypothetical protein